MEDPGPILSLLVVIVLIFLNATFVAAEFAFARLRRTQVDYIVESGTGFELRAGKVLQTILNDINNYISTCQVGITIASLSLGAIAEAEIEDLISPWLLTLPVSLDVHVVSIVLAVTVITYFHVVLGEVVPKSLALAKPEEVGLSLAHFISFVRVIFRLPVAVLNYSANLCLRTFGVEPVLGEVIHSEDELKRILSSSQEEGILEKAEEEIIQNVFDFNDTIAKEVMVPRTDMVCLSEKLSIREATEKINETNYSRYPIFKEKLDNITGYVMVKDVLKAYSEGRLEETLSAIAKTVHKAPDGVYIIDLLKDMQKHKKQIAVLIDEFGGTSGLVTVEDMIEEIFGDISDKEEDPGEEEAVRKIRAGEYIVDGLVTLKDLNEEIGADFDSEHYDTIGGLVFGLVGTEPKQGDKVEYGDFILVVEKHGKQRVKSVRVLAK